MICISWICAQVPVTFVHAVQLKIQFPIMGCTDIISSDSGSILMMSQNILIVTWYEAASTDCELNGACLVING